MNVTTFSQPRSERYFEDYVVGGVYEFGKAIVTQAEIIEYAKQFDPQPFHIDPEAAERSIYGGIIASGWHTGSITMRLLVDHFVSTVAGLGSPGMDELRWLKPVRPGDELAVRITVLEARRSNSRPDRGILKTLGETLNQNREVVMEMKSANFVSCRDAGNQQ
ncbi:MAG: MaoC family dehydratase [Gammaproteobacteria bacterium]|jgi:acyl dehydratase|nr:MaoC family dehydratase [Gammaproteobacteria bacterium]